MKLNVFLVTYDGDKRIEERWEDIPEDRKKREAEMLTKRFMKAAGFVPAKVLE